MSEPPPSPLDTTESQPLKRQTSNIPCSPAAGSQKARLISAGVRGKLSGGYACPRSSKMTDKPDSASRYAVTAPPKPDPTTTASACSGAGLRGPGPVAISGRLPLEELADPREDVGVGALAHDRVDVSVAREDLELGQARRDLAKQLVAGDVR